MGGTTAKASIVEDGEVTRAAEYQVGGGIMLGSRLLSGAGYLLRVPAIDLAEVGAGGGSVVWIDPGSALQVGPRSAGASPGPLCYDLGGTEPTITDANVILGYLNPARLAGGAVMLNAARAHEVFEEKVARPLGMPLVEAAHGAHLIAASNMMRAIRAVSSERGRDPREYALFAFGGNGPLSRRGWASNSRCAGSWCHPRPASSRRSGSYTRTWSTTTYAPGVSSCAMLTRPDWATSCAAWKRAPARSSPARASRRIAWACGALRIAATRGSPSS
jgi:N-methylhydantoinase A